MEDVAHSEADHPLTGADQPPGIIYSHRSETDAEGALHRIGVAGGGASGLELVTAFGDCAACPWPGSSMPVTPRAQAAHREASHMARRIERLPGGKKLLP